MWIGFNWLRRIQFRLLVNMTVNQDYAAFIFRVYLSALTMEAAGTSETLVYIYHTIQCHIQQVRNLVAHHRKNPKSQGN
jgi:hypothetical protein